MFKPSFMNAGSLIQTLDNVILKVGFIWMLQYPGIKPRLRCQEAISILIQRLTAPSVLSQLLPRRIQPTANLKMLY
jgi:hypothetical protein